MTKDKSQCIAEGDRLAEQAMQVVEAMPSSINDDLHQWAIDASEMLRDMVAALAARSNVQPKGMPEFPPEAFPPAIPVRDADEVLRLREHNQYLKTLVTNNAIRLKQLEAFAKETLAAQSPAPAPEVLAFGEGVVAGRTMPASHAYLCNPHDNGTELARAYDAGVKFAAAPCAAVEDSPAAEVVIDTCADHEGRIEADVFLPAGTKLYTRPAQAPAVAPGEQP